jgi:hypothetical protein
MPIAIRLAVAISQDISTVPNPRGWSGPIARHRDDGPERPSARSSVSANANRPDGSG